MADLSGLSGSPALDLGLQGHRRPWATQAQGCPAHATPHAHMPTQPCQCMALAEALRKALSGVPMCL